MYLQRVRRLWAAVIVAALVLPHPAQAAQPTTILVMGDSLSAGHGMSPKQSWVALLQRRLEVEGYRYRVINASASGETTTGGRARLARALLTHKPGIVILELGSNDGLRGLPLRQMRTNLETMIDQARQHGAKVVLIGMRMPPNYGPDYSTRFHATFGELAQEYKLPWVGFFLEGIALNPKMMQDDQLHPTAAAQPRLLQNVWPHLRPLLHKEAPITAHAGGR